MKIDPIYEAKVNLLLRVLPHVAKEDMFALKGGTAINFFEWEMPRLSVDIDLCYTPLDKRETALENISTGLLRIKDRLQNAIPGINVTPIFQKDGTQAKLSVLVPEPEPAEIKVEVNTILRGEIWPSRIMRVTEIVEKNFNKFAAINVLSHKELFGGKICAALDRQHPRDLFDVYYLLQKDGFTEDVKTGFLSVLLGGSRPIHEMIHPNLQDQREIFDTKFKGMTREIFTYGQFEETRSTLIQKIHQSITDSEKQFLISFKIGTPQWDLFPAPRLKEMPAVIWKLQNIQKLIKQNPTKHKRQLKTLEDTLSAI